MMKQRQTHVMCFNRGKHYFTDGVPTKQAQSLATVRPTPLSCTLTASLLSFLCCSVSLLYTLFLLASFLLPIWPLFEHKQLFLTVHLWGSRLMCVRCGCFFKDTQYKEETQTHTHISHPGRYPSGSCCV